MATVRIYFLSDYLRILNSTGVAGGCVAPASQQAIVFSPGPLQMGGDAMNPSDEEA